MNETHNEEYKIALPAPVGAPVYIVSAQTRAVYTSRIAGYIIRGEKTRKNRVTLMYKDEEGLRKYSYWNMVAFGVRLFTDRDEAFRRMEEVWNK